MHPKGACSKPPCRWQQSHKLVGPQGGLTHTAMMQAARSPLTSDSSMSGKAALSQGHYPEASDNNAYARPSQSSCACCAAKTLWLRQHTPKATMHALVRLCPHLSPKIA